VDYRLGGLDVEGWRRLRRVGGGVRRRWGEDMIAIDDGSGEEEKVLVSSNTSCRNHRMTGLPICRNL